MPLSPHILLEIITSAKTMQWRWAVFLVCSMQMPKFLCRTLVIRNKLSDSLEGNLKETICGLRSREFQSVFIQPTSVTSKASLFDIGSLRRNHRGPAGGIGLVWLLRERAWMLNCNHVNFINFKLIIWEGLWHQDGAKEKYPYTTPINTCYFFCYYVLFLKRNSGAAETTRQGGPGVGEQTPGFFCFLWPRLALEVSAFYKPFHSVFLAPIRN